MVLEERRVCDFTEIGKCQGGKYVYHYSCGHDVCSLCWSKEALEGYYVNEGDFCSFCLSNVGKKE